MAEQKINIALESSVEDVKSSIGATGNTGGSTTAGTIFGKLNKIIADLASHISSWTSTRAGYIDRLANGTYGLDKIKADTGSILSKVNSGVSASPKGYSLIVKSGNFNCSTAGSYTTVVNVTGQGYFCYAGSEGTLYSNSEDIWRDIKVTIDGTVKYWFCSSFTKGTSVTTKVAIADAKYVKSSGSTPYMLGSSRQFYVTGHQNTNGSSKVTHRGDIYHVLSDSIAFNSSLKVEIGTKSMNSYSHGWAVGYIIK